MQIAALKDTKDIKDTKDTKGIKVIKVIKDTKDIKGIKAIKASEVIKVKSCIAGNALREYWFTVLTLAKRTQDAKKIMATHYCLRTQCLAWVTKVIKVTKDIKVIKATKDTEGNSCEWCSFQGYDFCLDADQAEVVEQYGASCEKEVNNISTSIA